MLEQPTALAGPPRRELGAEPQAPRRRGGHRCLNNSTDSSEEDRFLGFWVYEYLGF